MKIAQVMYCWEGGSRRQIVCMYVEGAGTDDANTVWTYNRTRTNAGAKGHPHQQVSIGWEGVGGTAAEEQ